MIECFSRVLETLGMALEAEVGGYIQGQFVLHISGYLKNKSK